MNLKTASEIATSLAILYILINLFTGEAQFNASIHLTVWMQSYRSLLLDLFMALWSFLGFPFLVLFLVIYTFLEPNKHLAYKMVFFCVNTGFLNGLLKLIYTSPRPWFADESVIAMECVATDFGRPSGHSMFSIYVGIMFYRTYVYNTKHDPTSLPEDIESLELGSLANEEPPAIGVEDTRKKMIFKLFVLSVILVGISRIYRGAHSFDQVLLGWSYGILCFHLTVYYLEKPVEDLFDYLGGKRGRSFRRHFLVLVLVFCGCLLAPLIIFAIKENTMDLSPWLALIKEKCGISDKNQTLLVYSLYTAAFDSLTFGILFGIMFASRNILRATHVVSTYKTLILKLLVALVIYSSIGSVIYVIPLGRSPYVIYVLKVSTYLFLISFFLLAVLPRVFRRLNLEREIDDAHAGTSLKYRQITNPYYI